MVAGGLLNVLSYVPPDTATRSIIFLSAVGEATLVLELRDSESGRILARSIDTRAAETIGDTVSHSNSVTNSSEARRLIRFWAQRMLGAWRENKAWCNQGRHYYPLCRPRGQNLNKRAPMDPGST